jgi:hypothetical protein
MGYSKVIKTFGRNPIMTIKKDKINELVYSQSYTNIISIFCENVILFCVNKIIK